LEELFAAIDETEKFEYLEIIIGLKEDVERIERMIPQNFTHMTRYCSNKAEKLELVNKFDFKGNIRVYCAKFALHQLEQKIEDKLKEKKKSRKPKHISHNILSCECRTSLDSMYGDFVKKFGYSLDEIKFQVDNKVVKDILDSSGLDWMKPLETHKLMDCVAHVNGKHWGTSKVILELDEPFKKEFHKRVINRIIR
jgi:hypothetical protein